MSNRWLWNADSCDSTARKWGLTYGSQLLWKHNFSTTLNTEFLLTPATIIFHSIVFIDFNHSFLLLNICLCNKKHLIPTEPYVEQPNIEWEFHMPVGVCFSNQMFSIEIQKQNYKARPSQLWQKLNSNKRNKCLSLDWMTCNEWEEKNPGKCVKQQKCRKNSAIVALILCSLNSSMNEQWTNELWCDMRQMHSNDWWRKRKTESDWM